METSSSEILIAGCGVGGLSAAAAALEAGANVTMIDRAGREECGGNTRYTEAFLRMKALDQVSDDFEDRLTEHGGMHLDPSIIGETIAPYDKWSAITKALSFADPEIVHTFATECSSILPWLTGHGLRFEPLPTPFITTSAPRLAPVGGGRQIVETLRSMVERAGGRIRYDCTGRSLIRDDDGRVTGMEIQNAQGHRERVLARSVILATGGFEGNAEMLARYIGPQSRHVRPVARGGYHNKGEGIRMALKVGAAPAGDYTLFHAEPVDPRSGAPEAAIFAYPYGVLVNVDGNRFVDEGRDVVDLTYEAIARLICTQPSGIAYLILDASHQRIPRIASAIRTDVPPIKCDTIEVLAGQLGIAPKALMATISNYNEGCADGQFAPTALDDLHTTGVNPPKSNWAMPLREPPYFAYPMMSSNVFTFGGVKVNSEARVLNADGRPITGLFAAGEVIGLYYGRYTGSTSVLRGAVFGRLAGTHAAADNQR